MSSEHSDTTQPHTPQPAEEGNLIEPSHLDLKPIEDDHPTTNANTTTNSTKAANEANQKAANEAEKAQEEEKDDLAFLDEDDDEEDEELKEAEREAPREDARPNLYVNNLPEHIRDPDLIKLFQPFGKILKAKVMIDLSTGTSRGFGFVLLDSAAAASRALRALDQVSVAGHLLDVQFSQHKTDHLVAPSDFVMIRNIPLSTTQAEIIILCSKYGNVATVNITSQGQGYKAATVKFTEASDGPRRAEAELHDRTNPFAPDSGCRNLLVKQGENKGVRLVRQLQQGNARGQHLYTMEEQQAIIEGREAPIPPRRINQQVGSETAGMVPPPPSYHQPGDGPSVRKLPPQYQHHLQQPAHQQFQPAHYAPPAYPSSVRQYQHAPHFHPQRQAEYGEYHPPMHQVQQQQQAPPPPPPGYYGQAAPAPFYPQHPSEYYANGFGY